MLTKTTKTTKNVRAKRAAGKSKKSAQPKQNAHSTVSRIPGWKVQLQRKQLIAIGIDLFCKKGYKATSVAEIASTAGVSEQTFYRYFRTKDELAFDWNDENGRRALACLADRPKTEQPIESMKTALASLIKVIDGDKATWEKMVLLIYSSPALEARVAFVGVQWCKLFATTLKQGRQLTAKESFHIDVAVASVMAAFNVATYDWAHQKNSESLAPWVAEAFLVF